ncbi:MAG: hypothetical protein KBS79_03710 [Lachnospiraceae bacterium]|nr:hypothetical protein [Candidatus Minthocola equi]
MAEKKIVKSTNEVSEHKQAAPVGNATGLRIGAIACWLVALGCEVVAVLALMQKINIFAQGEIDMIAMIGALVIDLILVIVGSTLWKKANRIDPASEKNKFKFWLWNNLGVIVSVIAFVPFIIIALTDKKADKKTKTIAVVVAAIALLIGGVASYDFNPVSSEQLEAAKNALGTSTVYWTVNGNTVHKYHNDSDCYHLKNTKNDEIYEGSVEQAFQDNATSLCKTCQKNHQEIEGINDVDTGDKAE